MASNVADTRRHVRYEPDESPPNLLSLGFGMQHAMLAVPSIVLGPALLIQAAGGSDAQLMWAVCTALAICGITTAVQAVRVGRIGAGYVMLMGSSSAFLAVSVSALEQGGPGLLATLIIVASLFQFALAARLSALRRIFTPTVAGTAVMLIPVTLTPIILGKLADVPDGASAAAAPVTAGMTLLVIVVTALRGSSVWRLWGPIAGIVAGTVTGSLAFGLYDTAGIRQAGWIGLPPIAWPGLDLGFGVEFLTAGERSGLFAMEDALYGCYLRVGDPGPWAGPWAGIARLEMPSGIGRDAAVEAVDRAAGWLPGFASALHRNARAPVSLTPIAGLERHLHRLQGDARLALRAVREAVLERNREGRTA